MASIVVSKLRTENFESWKAVYDRGEPLRRELGVRAITVVRDAADPNVVTVMTRFDTVAAAKGMFASERFQALAKSSGSTILEASFTEVADDRTYA